MRAAAAILVEGAPTLLWLTAPRGKSKTLQRGSPGWGLPMAAWPRRPRFGRRFACLRHPVRHLRFSSHSLITANIPNEKTPRGASITDDDLTTQRRHRGIIYTYEFSTDKLMAESVLPICCSPYNEVVGYSYNIGLVVPYDHLGRVGRREVQLGWTLEKENPKDGVPADPFGGLGSHGLAKQVAEEGGTHGGLPKALITVL
ncbi:F-box/WD repeat-containing protein 8-like [Crotalus adamanteus]|uniref:F-box/WD repeat-containing protein 8-like n=1 Tax=Crotalus adamanteus TaxID=8729 RepID=A0AAW1ARA6_CROAD